jgi:hypothetical protein
MLGEVYGWDLFGLGGEGRGRLRLRGRRRGGIRRYDVNRRIAMRRGTTLLALRVDLAVGRAEDFGPRWKFRLWLLDSSCTGEVEW